MTHPDVTRGLRNDVFPVPSMLDSQTIATPNSQIEGQLKGSALFKSCASNFLNAQHAKYDMLSTSLVAQVWIFFLYTKRN